MKYVCDVCGWVYDESKGSPENGIPAGTKFSDLPEDFVCPLCGVDKDNFSEEQKRNPLKMRGFNFLYMVFISFCCDDSVFYIEFTDSCVSCVKCTCV